MESDCEVLIQELAVQLDQFRVFIPILGWTPQLPELLPNLFRVIEGEIIVNGTPCAVQSASNPTVENIWIKSAPKGPTVNPHTHGRN